MSTFALKILAIITMLIDHAGVLLIPQNTPQYVVFRAVGRIAFPIFAFLIVEGYFHTRDISKYMKRLAVFAIISEIPYNLLLSGQALSVAKHSNLVLYEQLFNTSGQNVFFTLLAGLAAIYCMKKYERSKYSTVLLPLALALAAELLHTDYGAFGVVTIIFFYVFRNNRLSAIASVGALNIAFACLGFFDSNAYIQGFAVLAMIPIYFYSGNKGPSLKYFFYAFYPVHILLLFAAAVLIG